MGASWMHWNTPRISERIASLRSRRKISATRRAAVMTIIEIWLFEGRSVAAKKKLYALLFERCETQIGIAPVELEITLTETPRHNWGIRGAPGDVLGLEYKVAV